MPDVISEESLRNAVDVLVRLVEAAGAVVIVVGAAIGFARFLIWLVRRQGTGGFTSVRLDLGRFLVLGLEFQLAGDILRTAIAPTFEDLGQLAAVAAIRTALNYFLAKEIKEEQAEIAREQHDAGGGDPR